MAATSHPPSKESPENRHDFEIIYEDANGRLIDHSSLFYLVSQLLPSFRMQNYAIGKVKLIRFILSESGIPSASVKWSEINSGEVSLKLYLGIYLALSMLPSTIAFIDRMLNERRRIAKDELLGLQVPDSALTEVHNLLLTWQYLESSGWRAIARPGEQITFPISKFSVPVLLFMIGHELGHYFQHIAKETTEETTDTSCDQIADKMILECLDKAGVTNNILRDRKVPDGWKLEIAADQYAFLATEDRLSPGSGYTGPRLPKYSQIAGLAGFCEPDIQSDSEAQMYTYVAAEMMFGLVQLFEWYCEVCCGKPISSNMGTHPPARIRRNIFTYIRAKTGKSMPRDEYEFLATQYGAGLVTRVTMDKVLEEYARRVRINRIK